ncbi:ribonucleotide-diphosphate reductase subunit alpha [Thermococci archaeon]|nr:MAG: ribonucleotide-diphosphate reductase subunit alpha [Thermococci archaeon]RLF97394.1 MAG: ribonucleotide-diphosphate reductase subunit alpha [Thermococci archaeon]
MATSVGNPRIIRVGSERVELSENALRVLEQRYLLKDEEGRIVETPEEMFRRVARDMALAGEKFGDDPEEWEEKFYEVMAKLEFIPNSPTLMNAGTKIRQFSACFVLPIGDSMDSIFETLKNTALIHKTGGGTGFDFSNLRPEGDIVGSTKGVASGPISFMKVYDSATEQVKQGGRRRGANMGILHVWHPDIEKFVVAKDKEGEIRNFNISVGVTDEFMRAVIEDREFPLINPRTKEIVRRIRAKELFEKIAYQAWKNGEPGLIFFDTVNRFNPTPKLGEIRSTNPCGEVPLLPYESCNLGSINLSKFVSNGKIDWKRLEYVVRVATRFLDNVIEASDFPISEINEATRRTRKIGLGVMGFADMLIKLGIRYDSEDALKIAEKVMERISYWSMDESVNLSLERGPFPAFEDSIYPEGELPFRWREGELVEEWESLIDRIKRYGIRNATTTSIAPTGTISIIAGCSSGIEPLFSIAYVKSVTVGDLVEVNPLFEESIKKAGIYSEDLMRRVAEEGRISGIEEIPEEIKRTFRTALEISPEWHIRMQASFQKFVALSISKTINMPNSAEVEDVMRAYKLAWELGCKGITVYREGSREEQVLYVGTEKRKEEKKVIRPRPRPHLTYGATIKMPTGCGNLYVTINEDEKGLFEVFARLGKAGGCAASQTEAIGRLISLALRSGVDVSALVKQLRGIRCPSPHWSEDGLILSCPDAIGKAIEKYIKWRNGIKSKINGIKINLERETKGESNEVIGVCPNCGNPLAHQEGCATCPACGYTKCL